jgi:hypothetical protein
MFLTAKHQQAVNGHKTTIKVIYSIRELSKPMELGVHFGWVTLKNLIFKLERILLYVQEELCIIQVNLFIQVVMAIKILTTQ